MKKVLLFGFSGFDRFSRNPSRDLVIDLARQRWKGVRVDKIILKVSYAQVGKKIPALLNKEEYDAIIGFGLARNAARIWLEKQAHNGHDSDIPDCDGCLKNKKKILPGRPGRYRSTVNLSRLRTALMKQHIPASLSQDAGGYLCNYTYYLLLHHLRQARRRTKCLFVHIPLSCEIACRVEGEYPSLPRATLSRAGQIIVNYI